MKQSERTMEFMDYALSVGDNPFVLRKLPLSVVAAVARCYNAPYHTYGRVQAYIREFASLPPREYLRPRIQWQRNPRLGAKCRKCILRLTPEDCEMLRMRDELGLSWDVQRCSEFKRCDNKETKRRDNGKRLIYGE